MVVREILERWFDFGSVLDVGCGTGEWLNCFAINSGRTILGLSIENISGAEIDLDPGQVLRVEFGKDVDLARRFDLALCLEAGGRVDPRDAAALVGLCVGHSDVVLFSAAMPGQCGPRHINARWPEYWAALFEQHDYAVFDGVRSLIWDDSNIPVNDRQNILLYARRGSPCFASIEAHSTDAMAKRPLAVAHPEYLASLSDKIDRLSSEAAASREAELVAASQAGKLQQLLTEAKANEFAIANSTSWLIFTMLRQLARFIPLPLRRLVRDGLARLVRMLPKAKIAPASLMAETEVPSLKPLAPATSGSRLPWGFPSIIRQIVFVSGESGTPGHEYRVVRYAKAAAAIGVQVHWLALEDYRQHRPALLNGGIVVLWRVADCPAAAAVIRMARAGAARVVFDTDDLIFRHDIATIDMIDGIRSQNLSEARTSELYRRFRAVMDQADVCFCSTRELADQIRRTPKPAYVLPNGFDYDSFMAARRAMRQWRAGKSDQLIRIGYASGTRTHQRDFAIAAKAIARVLAEHDDCRLVLFGTAATGLATLDIDEFPCLKPVAHQIEWREMVPLLDLPNELARFDINLAPLEVGNVYCEAKSELKYFEAALVDVCTIASPTGPMARAMKHNETGLLAATPDDWYVYLKKLALEPELRSRMSRAALYDVMVQFGPNKQQEQLLFAVQELMEGPRGARGFELGLHRARQSAPERPKIGLYEVLFSTDSLRGAEVTVMIPLYNYADYIIEALDSVRDQTLADLDVIVIDDASTDHSATLVVNWMRENAARFNRAIVLRNTINSGLAVTRNTGFDAAETAFILPLDADNRLLPRCCEICLTALRESSAGFAYPSIQQFGDAKWRMGEDEFLPSGFIGANYVDAMALICKWAWLEVGGYFDIRLGWEDYDFWCRCVERGIGGVRVPDIVAEYRVHGTSMLRTTTNVTGNNEQVIACLEQQHPWLRIVPLPR